MPEFRRSNERTWISAQTWNAIRNMIEDGEIRSDDFVRQDFRESKCKASEHSETRHAFSKRKPNPTENESRRSEKQRLNSDPTLTTHPKMGFLEASKPLASMELTRTVQRPKIEEDKIVSEQMTDPGPTPLEHVLQQSQRLSARTAFMFICVSVVVIALGIWATASTSNSESGDTDAGSKLPLEPSPHQALSNAANPKQNERPAPSQSETNSSAQPSSPAGTGQLASQKRGTAMNADQTKALATPAPNADSNARDDDMDAGSKPPLKQSVAEGARSEGATSQRRQEQAERRQELQRRQELKQAERRQEQAERRQEQAERRQEQAERRQELQRRQEQAERRQELPSLQVLGGAADAEQSEHPTTPAPNADSGVSEADCVEWKPVPEYPEQFLEAPRNPRRRWRKVEGYITAQFDVTVNGQVTNVRFVDGNIDGKYKQDFQEIVLEKTKEWRLCPAQQDGHNVAKQSLEETFSFNVKD